MTGLVRRTTSDPHFEIPLTLFSESRCDVSFPGQAKEKLLDHHQVLCGITKKTGWDWPHMPMLVRHCVAFVVVDTMLPHTTF